MKILAIRGKNLASLAGEFAVDFQREPLASAGLYAISGSTGSGKSTLLDALCLALYERTPRLARAAAKGEAIPDVGDNAVSPSDARTILRRGAAEGFAEVDFVGCDGLAYRARWSVRRARLKAEGKLQPSDISLTRLLDGQVQSEHTKTDTLRLIEGRVGLSFEQFTRAVLLAQNDFASFLKAPDDERAELLQTLTGSEAFAEISRQAFARMKQEKEALERLQAQLQDQQALAPEARAEKEAQHQAHAAQAQALQAQQAATEAHVRWYQQQEKYQAEHGEAGSALRAATAEHTAAAPRYAELALLEQVQAARPLWAACERARQAGAQAAQVQADAAAALAQVRLQEHGGVARHRSAQQQLADAEASRAQAQADIDTARALDASILAVAPQFDAALQAQTQARLQSEAHACRLADTAQQMAAARAERQSAERWRASHAALRPLAEGWQRWETLLEQAQQTLDRQTPCQQACEQLAGQAASNTQAAATAQTALERASTSSQSAEDALQALNQRCAAIDGEQLAADKKAVEADRDQLQAAQLLWQRRSDVRARRISLQEQQQAQTLVLQHSLAALQACAQELPLCEGQLQSAEQALQRARLAASRGAETLRGQLQPDQACPVCGALEHPYAVHAPVVDAMLQGLQEHVAQCQQALREAQQRQAHAVASQASAHQALDPLGRELEQLAGQRTALLREWSALALAEALEAVPEAQHSAWLQARQELARTALARHGAQEDQHRQTLQHRDAAQQQFNSATRAQTQARQALDQLLATGAQIHQAQAGAQRQLSELAQQLAATLQQLAPAFADADAAWALAWRAAPQSFVAQARSNAGAWTQQQAASATLTQRLAELQVQSQAMEAACTQSSGQLQTLTAACQASAATLRAYTDQRAGLLAGRTVAERERELNAALAQARSALQAAQDTLQQLLTEAARLAEASRLADQQVLQQGAAQAQAQAALQQWLQAFQAQSGAAVPALTLAALQDLLASDPDAMARERQALQALQSAVGSAQAVLQARQKTLAEHAAVRATADSAETLQETLDQCRVALATLTQTLSALQLELALDTQRRQQSAALQRLLEQQSRVSGVWSRLSDLIGSADGKKFRNFAQQYTLDVLLGYGNRQLQGLSTRYRLQRIEGSLGLLVVDQDMGDELRSVHSLSGGESFLVSLALALGLASLSSHRVRVESLFIDEGFGSLDAEALRVAMDALDSLQSQGRKVGVISHVQEMTERIGTRVQVQRQAGGLSRVLVA